MKKETDVNPHMFILDFLEQRQEELKKQNVIGTKKQFIKNIKLDEINMLIEGIYALI